MEDLEEGTKADQDISDKKSIDRKRKEKRVELQVDLKYYFTEEEMRDLMMEMAKTNIHRNDLEDTLKKVGADYRAKIQEDEGVINKNARLINNGFEYRRTEAYKLLDYGVGIVSIFRKDNGILIEERPMTDSEKQVPLI
jgi:phosphoribosylaminoimidazole (AIR) synthetase